MELSLPWFFWLFPLAFALHNLEETLWLPAFSKSADRFHKPVDTFEYVFAVTVLTLLAVVITLLFYGYGKQSFAADLFFAFNLGMLLNVFFPHLAATVALKKYCPGLLTGIFLLIPVTAYILWYGYQQEYFILPQFLYIAIPFMGFVIGSIPLLFKLGKSLQRRF